MERRRVALLVYVDLDYVPGTMHTKESAEEVIFSAVNNIVPHYNPRVEIAPWNMQPEQRVKDLTSAYGQGFITDESYIKSLNTVHPGKERDHG